MHGPEELIPWHGLKDRSYLLILGEPGSGKTTLLREWLLSYVNKIEQGEASAIPVCLQLRHLRQGETLEAALRRTAVEANAGWLSENLSALAERGELAVAFDGVDEVPVEDRYRAIEQIQHFTSTFRRCRYIITSRPSVDFRTSVGFDRAEITPLDQSRRRQLAHYKLYRHGGWERFSSRLESEPSYGALLGNPLAYTYMLSKYIRYAVAPSYVSELVSGLVDLFVDDWDTSRGIIRAKQYKISPGTSMKLLTFLAREMSKQHRASLTTNDLDQSLSHLLPEIGVHRALTMTSDHSGLLTYAEGGGWSFRHRIYLDYFDAMSQVSSLSSGVDRFLRLIRRISPPVASALARFVGYLSTDISSAVTRIISGAKPDDLTTTVNLTRLLSQRLVVEDSVLAGFTHLAVATLSRQLEMLNPQLVHTSSASAYLQVNINEGNSDLAANLEVLLEAIYQSRDGVGGEALKAALDARADPRMRAVGEMLMVNGTLDCHREGKSVIWFVNPLSSEVDFEVGLGGAQP